jgi:hypothetical protein
VVLEAFLLNELLGHGIAGREEDCGGDALGEQWARGQLSLVPTSINVSIALSNLLIWAINSIEEVDA